MGPKPWLHHYPAGVPVKIDPEQYPTILHLLRETFARYGKLKAFSCMGKELTFEEVDRMANDLGAYLQSRGLQPGDKIALMMPNLLQYPIALFAALRAGLVIVNTNPLYTPREMLHQFNDAGVKAIIIAENFGANLQKILPETGINTIITTSIGEMLGTVKGAIVNFVVRKLKGMVPPYQLPNEVSFTQALRQGRKLALRPHEGTPDEVVLLQYTGGTTGVSKGAMLTNRNIVANMLQIKAWMQPFLKEGTEVVLCPLPLYHIFAFTVNLLAMMSYGGLSVLVTNARDLPSVIKVLKSYKVSIITGVNTLFNALLNHPDFAALDFSALKITVGGAMAIQRPVAEAWQKATGCILSEGYGMTEAAPVITTNPLDGTSRIGTIGLPVPSTEVRIVDEQGKPLPPGQVGEIQAKGPQVMKGYYNRPEETALTIVEDGWLCTGDIGIMTEDGFFQIVDRKKDMILVSGFNVFPNEVEEVAMMHPKVMEAAAVGVADTKSGEAVKLFIVKKDSSLTEDELLAFCRERLTGYKLPRTIEFRKELPKTNVGKILRRMLKDEAS
jgi:long-chain acyl-CoA synthetase